MGRRVIHDLNTADGLRVALAEAGNSWAELSRRSGEPVSTLKSRGKKLSVSRAEKVAASEIESFSLDELARPASRPIGNRPETKRLAADLVEQRRAKLEAALRGDLDELSSAEFNLAVELDSLNEQHDHLRLLRAANLTIHGWSKRMLGGTPRQYIQKVAARCNVDSTALEAYVLVLRGEIRYRQSAGEAPLTTLPQLVEPDQIERAAR